MASIRPVRRFLALMLLCALPVLADAGRGLVTEVYPLGFRTVEEVAPVLRPLVPPPGAVTGLRNQLVIRTTPENMEEVRKVLAAMDHPPRSLLISVKREALDRQDETGAAGRVTVREGDARVSAGGGPRIPGAGRVLLEDDDERRLTGRVYSSRGLAAGRGVQTIRTVEGHDAFISAGVELPPRRLHGRAGDAAAYRRVVRGFYVRPLVAGDRVRVEIRSTDSRLNAARGGMLRSSVADTVVSGRVGEWLVVGRHADREHRSRAGLGYGAGAETLAESTLLLKVEVMP